jgi:YD repeat-containing protein
MSGGAWGRGQIRSATSVFVGCCLRSSNNTSNELTSRPGFTYTYDSNGNRLTSVSGSNTTHYTWDFENRLSSVTLPGSGGTVSFKYDPFGRRVEKVSSSATSIYAYDGDNLSRPGKLST